MYNPDYPTTSYGWNAFTYQPYDQQQNQTGFYYSGQPSNPFANTQAAPNGSRRAIGQQFAQSWAGQTSQPYGYSAPQQPQQQIAPVPQPQNYPGVTYGSMLSPNAFQQPSVQGQSPAPAFDCLYNTPAVGSVWDKSTSQTPVWDNPYTQERKLVAPPIDWTASQRPQQPQPNYGYGYSASNINPACNPQFAQPNEDWLATVKNNFANL